MDRAVAGNVHVLRDGQEDASSRAVPKSLLCVSDSEVLRSHVKHLSNAGWETVLVPNAESAFAVLRERDEIRVGLAWLRPDNSSVVGALAADHSRVKWVAVTERRDLEDVSLRRVLAGAFHDYHTLPIEPDRLLVVLGHAVGMAALQCETLEDEPFTDTEHVATGFHGMVGRSKGMRAVYATIDKVARTDFPVLISGRSGTGKELVAKAIHDRSERSEQPLVVVNCGALTPTLVQSELFGHEKGSFTNADARKEGHFETAHGGTIFLDEIAELPLETQANLLRVLEEKSVRRVGGSRNIPTDVRVMAATNSDLSGAVKAGQFREDLFYRLSVVQITLPSLSERSDDIEELATYYLRRFASELGSKANGFSRQAVEAMLAHAWPGNVRELINRIKRSALMCENHLVRPGDLGLACMRMEQPNDSGVNWMTLRKVREEAEKNALIETMSRANSNISLAAEILGVSRVTLYNLLKKYEMR